MHDKMARLADVWKTCNKIRAAAFRVGLNLWDWYRPLDPHGNALISESQFVSVLCGPLRAHTGLSAAEVAQLADYFRAQDGRVLYQQLCTVIHGEDAGGRSPTSGDCVLESCPPPAAPACHTLDRWQARRLCCLLATIADRDLPLKPYFQDYELVAKTDGRITFAHFARLLYHVGVLVSAEDFNLLVRRFIKDSYTLDYVQFLQAVDAVKREGIRGLGPEYRNPRATLDTALPKLHRPELSAPNAPAPPPPLGPSDAFHPALRPRAPQRHLLELMLRVQEFVKQRRIRVSEFFRDYDPLNCGRIAPTQFRRALDQCGLGAALAPDELQCVANHYRDPNDPQSVCWRTFEDDCDQVFTIKELEKHPDVCPGAAAAAVAELPARGAAESRAEPTPHQLDLAEAALLRLRAACTERSIDLRPAFSDHDDHNSGHVSRAQVRRVLARVGVLPAAAHVRALEDRYTDDCGFSYVRLLDELEVSPATSAALSAAGTAAAGPAHSARSTDPLLTDIVHILAKIKGKIVREGVRPRDFLQQFDPRRELVVARADFYRGLAAAGLALAPQEMDTLMEVFCAPGRRRYIEYERFCSCVGEALTMPGLERAPLVTPVPHVPARDASHYYLGFEERALVAGALDKLAQCTDQVYNIMEVFQELDPSRSGCVSRAAAERALGRRGLLSRVSPRERQAVYRCFGYKRGQEDQVNYRGLVSALDLIHATASAQPC